MPAPDVVLTMRAESSRPPCRPPANGRTCAGHREPAAAPTGSCSPPSKVGPTVWSAGSTTAGLRSCCRGPGPRPARRRGPAPRARHAASARPAGGPRQRGLRRPTGHRVGRGRRGSRPPPVPADHHAARPRQRPHPGRGPDRRDLSRPSSPLEQDLWLDPLAQGVRAALELTASAPASDAAPRRGHIVGGIRSSTSNCSAPCPSPAGCSAGSTPATGPAAGRRVAGGPAAGRAARSGRPTCAGSSTTTWRRARPWPEQPRPACGARQRADRPACSTATRPWRACSPRATGDERAHRRIDGAVRPGQGPGRGHRRRRLVAEQPVVLALVPPRSDRRPAPTVPSPRSTRRWREGDVDALRPSTERRCGSAAAGSRSSPPGRRESGRPPHRNRDPPRPRSRPPSHPGRAAAAVDRRVVPDDLPHRSTAAAAAAAADRVPAHRRRHRRCPAVAGGLRTGDGAGGGSASGRSTRATTRRPGSVLVVAHLDPRLAPVVPAGRPRRRDGQPAQPPRHPRPRARRADGRRSPRAPAERSAPANWSTSTARRARSGSSTRSPRNGPGPRPRTPPTCRGPSAGPSWP